MATPNTLTELDAAMKQLYRDNNESMVFFDGREAFGLMPKDESFGGRDMPLVVHFGRTGGRSAGFSNAQAIAAVKAKRIEDFAITGVDDYSLVHVPGKSLTYARNSTMAFDGLVASLAQKGLDDATENLANSIELAIWGDGTGHIASWDKSTGDSSKALAAADLAAALADNWVTLDDPINGDYAYLRLTKPDDAYKFELDDWITFAPTSALTQNAALIAKVYAIDPIAGWIAIEEVGAVDMSDINAAGARYFIFPYGDAYYNQADAAGSYKKIDGFKRWIPTVAPVTGDSFKGVDRSVSNRLYGKYFDCTGTSREQALMKSGTILAKEGGVPEVALISFTQARALAEELGLRKEIVDMNPVSERGLVANVGYRGYFVHVPGGAVKVVPAMKANADEAVMITPSDWSLLSAGPALNMEDYDGLVVLRKATEDAYEGRMVFRGNLICRKPGRQGRVALQVVV